MSAAAQPLACMRLLTWCAVPALSIAACGSSSTTSSIALSGTLTAQTSGDSIIQCGAQPATRTTDATTFELQLRVHPRGETDRLTVAIHDGIGGAGSYHVRPVHGPLTLKVYIEDSASESGTTALAATLRAVPGVVGVRYESKDEAAAEAAANSPDIASALATLGTNPFPASLVVSLADTRAVPTIDAAARASAISDATYPGLGASGATPMEDPRGVGEIALYTPEAHATSGATPDYEGEGTLTLNRDGRSGSVFAELVSQKGKKVGVTGSFAC